MKLHIFNDHLQKKQKKKMEKVEKVNTIRLGKKGEQKKAEELFTKGAFFGAKPKANIRGL